MEDAAGGPLVASRGKVNECSYLDPETDEWHRRKALEDASAGAHGCLRRAASAAFPCRRSSCRAAVDYRGGHRATSNDFYAESERECGHSSGARGDAGIRGDAASASSRHGSAGRRSQGLPWMA